VIDRPTELEPPLATDFKSEITTRVAEAGSSAAFANYLKVREAICVMMDDWSRLDPSGGPSAYWREEIEGFLYLFDASPLLVAKLREQCHHITGIKSYDYRGHHGHRRSDFVRKFQMLRAAAGGEELFVPEAPELGGFGFDVGPGLANIDTLKFFEVMIGLRKAGILDRFQEAGGGRRVAVEIGSGWGGFAYQFKRLCPQAAYVCVDLPPTMLFSAVYLMTLFPEARTLIYGEPDFERKSARLADYDFVFLPHYAFGRLPEQKLHLGLNMVSFQEMTTGQVDGYARTLKDFGCRRIYSLNKERSRHNDELTAVSEVLGRYYALNLIEVCPLQYTQLTAPKTAFDPGIYGYRHYFGHF
jgi:hypothetical protein